MMTSKEFFRAKMLTISKSHAIFSSFLIVTITIKEHQANWQSIGSEGACDEAEDRFCEMQSHAEHDDSH
jgi:hypothetical protein